MNDTHNSRMKLQAQAARETALETGLQDGSSGKKTKISRQNMTLFSAWAILQAILNRRARMTFHPERYPANWNEISQRIRERERNRCLFCGAENHKPHPDTGKIVVLTVAHLDHTEQNCSDENLAALCQRCHLRYDARQHATNAATTRHRKKLAAGQIEMIPRE
jgi:hypothetical protein